MAIVQIVLDPDAQSYADLSELDAAQDAKLDGIEANAKGDQTGAEIKTAYEAEPETNAFVDAEKTKLTGIAAGAEVNDADLAALDPTQNTKLNGIEALAEVNPADLDGVPDSASRFAASEANAKDDQIGTEIRDLIVGITELDRKILITDPAIGQKKVVAVQVDADGKLEADHNSEAEV